MSYDIKLCKIAFQRLSLAETVALALLRKGENPSRLPLYLASYSHFLMRKIIQFQTRQRVLKLLDKKQDRINLQKLKKSRYMRQDYKQTKKRLTVSMDLVDFKKIQKHAKISGITPTTFVRACTLAYLKDERVPSQKAENTLSELIFLLRNIGNNINQIARQSNAFQKVALGDFLHLKTLLGHLEDTAESAIRKLM